MNSSDAKTQTSEKTSQGPAAAMRRKGVDADALLRSLAPMVAKPDNHSAPAPQKADSDAEPARKPVRAELPEPADEDEDEAPRRSPSRKEAKRSKASRSRKGDDEPVRQSSKPPKGERNRATMDVEINPGEGTTAIYVRVPRTTHVALKILALQNQASLEGPTELASIVREAIGEYLERQQSTTASRAA